uniref:SecA Wing/Scaffold domain-containing protein n=1 Tax=Populus trichocarpa TaxID=3694 RepID=A0A2K2BF67_POPTR
MLFILLRTVLLKTLDYFWRDHLVNMNRLSSAVNVRSFGHRNPLEEYKIDGCRFFISMLSATRRFNCLNTSAVLVISYRISRTLCIINVRLIIKRKVYILLPCVKRQLLFRGNCFDSVNTV